MKQYVIWIDADVCKGCSLCVFYCPKDVLEMAEQMNQKGYHIAKVAFQDKCIGCMLCQDACPDFAIFVQENGQGE